MVVRINNVSLCYQFCGNIFKYKLFRRDKLAILGLHLSFILILVGAFVTRYIGYEGVMPIEKEILLLNFIRQNISYGFG